MKRLYVDVGNSRVKYAFYDGSMTALPHDGDPRRAIAQMLDAIGPPDEVILVDVTGAAAGALRGYPVRTLTASAASCGVTNAYPEPTRLGADRWAALIGARVRHGGAVCVVDAGSAITADVMTGAGAHLGGWIAPGLALAASALAHGTRISRTTSEGHAAPEFATDTADAICTGVLQAALGFVERASRTAERCLGQAPLLMFCGGDGATLAAEFPGAVVDEPLVLRGLMAWADSA